LIIINKTFLVGQTLLFATRWRGFVFRFFHPVVIRAFFMTLILNTEFHRVLLSYTAF